MSRPRDDSGPEVHDSELRAHGSQELVEHVLAGRRRALGRAISLIENGDSSVEEILRAVYPSTGNAYIVGLTGPPGAGKSTVADELVQAARGAGKRVGVIAVDPNSPFSGGAILGDRIRMMRHATDEGVFIRSMGARGHLGGLALATQNAGTLLDSAGYDLILFETVGVGQSELEVAGAADTTVVVIPPGLGDGVQAIKAGIMEIADIFAVNKADHPYVDKTVADIRDLLRMDGHSREWSPPIVKTVATRNEGVEDLWIRIGQHRQYLERSGGFERRRRERLERNILAIAEQRIRRQVLEPRIDSAEFSRVLDSVMERRIDPYAAADVLAPLEHSKLRA
jgi:LAO/AO transport system kinase